MNRGDDVQYNVGYFSNAAGGKVGEMSPNLREKSEKTTNYWKETQYTSELYPS